MGELQQGIEEYVANGEFEGTDQEKLDKYSTDAQEIIHESKEWKSLQAIRANEEKAINEMVDLGLISPEKAKDFHLEDEIKSPDSWTSGPPELSDALRKYVLLKFPKENFEPDNIAGTIIQGTSIQTIKPLWFGEGEIRTSGSGFATGKSGIDQAINQFRIVGDFTRLDKTGFHYLNPRMNNQRWPSFPSVNPTVYLIVGKSFYSDEREDEIDYTEIRFVGSHDRINQVDAEPENTSGRARISAVALSKSESLVKNPNAESGEKVYANRSKDGKKIYLTLEQEVNYIAHCMVKGIDKSKIVPIYDWDGNLLWPQKKEEDRTEK